MDFVFPTQKLLRLDQQGRLRHGVFRIFLLILRVFHETLTGGMEGAKMACLAKAY
jgi:hypothetical protein